MSLFKMTTISSMEQGCTFQMYIVLVHRILIVLPPSTFVGTRDICHYSDLCNESICLKRDSFDDDGQFHTTNRT